MADKEIVDKLMAELNQKITEVAEIYNTLQALKKYGAEIELPELESLLGSGGGISSTLGRNITFRPDEFYGLSNTEAAERYLLKAGQAMPIGDIYDALVAGGSKFTGDGRKNLNIQLTRATRKFAKIGSGFGVRFGLLEWYPKRKREKKETNGAEEEVPEEKLNSESTASEATPTNATEEK